MDQPMLFFDETERGLAELRAKWPWVLTLGVLLVGVGVVALVMAAATTLVSVLLLGVLVLGAGVLQVVQAFSAPQWSGFFLRFFVGVLYAVVGLIILTRPDAGALSLTVLMGLVFFAEGVFKTASSVVMRFEKWGWTLMSGIISFVLGALIISGWPTTALWVIGTFVGIDLIFDGWSLIVIALSGKRALAAKPSVIKDAEPYDDLAKSA